MNEHPDKKRLRAEVRARRRAMSWQQVRDGSAAICERLNELQLWRDAGTVCVYLSLGNEVITHELVHDALGAKRILIPRSHEGGTMTWHQLYEWEALEPGMYGILEPPPQSPEVDPPCPDLILVPGLAFDREGRRLGHGGGYYDRFLAHTGGAKVALAYDWQVFDHIPHQGHDVHMDAIVTDQQVLRFTTEQCS
ncbi:5-formyltetrahydrofolate cyclo-ligase [Ruficoccus sp. ZRK36]|uniref:5-formyltetrahydrofolate cyclo-ligase n=1 Tax=Ruficoccus sp. ZRK36 TaxID=2866311 RepID=UPI001C736441|nr:5-formyltetrahydrofolate cyclo-ligase [Ruficoccus sp. ZRK36]QYY35143.1 5-formyltetrahydrofolate cyclo-ligase [Ruficoccus sp. ZRK36]